MKMLLIQRYRVLLVILCGMPASVAANPEPLTRVEQVRSLTREQATEARPVQLRGTVVYKARGGRTFIIHDGGEGMSVHLFRAKELGIWQGGRPHESETEVGAVIEIEGVTGPAGYSPVLVPTRFRRVGSGPLPEPRQLSMERLISGSDASQRVVVEGVVQRSMAVDDGKWAMRLMVEGHPCEVDFQMAEGFDPMQTLDSRVRIRGFCSPVYNLRSESTRLRLLAWGKEDVTVIAPPPSDPFAAPRRPLNGLLQFSKTPDRFHRKVTAGTVNFVLPGRFFFLQEGDKGLLVESAATDLAVGDRLEVAGFVENTRGIASLSEALTRKLGNSPPPPPLEVTAKELLLPEIADRVEPVVTSDHFGCLVRIEGLVRQIERRSGEGLWSLLIESDGEIFRAQLPAPIVTYRPPWQVGTKLSIQGVCDLEFTPRKPGTNSPLLSGFNLWLRNPADVTVLSGPPWWTQQRLGIALGGMGSVLILALGWNLLLHRKVDEQMAVISSKLRSETIHTERNRLARDLHDTLEQQLVGVALQLDDAEQIIRHDPGAASEIVTLARRMLRHTRAEARRSVWDLRSEVLETGGLGPALESLAQSVASPSGPVVDVRIDPNYRSFPLETEFQLFRIAQEALANALKHAGAKHVVISLDAGPGEVCLSITDDGKGFSPGALDRLSGSHFGLLGMQERAERIGSRLTIDGNTGAGSRICVTLPRSANQATEPLSS
jgi:signal transduction histidine kinase